MTQKSGIYFLWLALLCWPCWALAQAPDAPVAKDTTSAQQVVKFDVFGLLNGSLIFGYQRQVNANVGLEAELGYIGVFDKAGFIDLSGAVFKLGAKLRFHSVYQQSITNQRWLQGGYVKPEFSYWAFSYQDEDIFNGAVGRNVRERAPALMFYIGREWISKGGAYAEVFFGGGIGWVTDRHDGDMHSVFVANDDVQSVGVLIGFGAKIGARINNRRFR